MHVIYASEFREPCSPRTGADQPTDGCLLGVAVALVTGVFLGVLGA
jgi:hypothetical protein